MSASTDADRLPFFVYGTLRPGQVNHAIFGDAVESLAPAALPGARLALAGHGSDYLYPYLWLAGDEKQQVVGDVVEVTAGDYRRLLATLDELEGYVGPGEDNDYDRVDLEVSLTVGGTARAWVYVGSAERCAHLPAIAGGDFSSIAKAAEARPPL